MTIVFCWITERAALLLLLFAAGAQAQTGTSSPYLTIDGQVTTPLSLSEADFQALPHASITVTDSTGKPSTYSVVDLAAPLTKAGVPLKQDLKGADIAKYLHVQGADGFVAIVSLPEFDNGAFLVADAQDSSPLPAGTGPLQVISPQESRHSRWVKQLKLLRIIKSSPQ
ncbi:molybdopterin-dependent oxidoreductase [Bradyrhizobium arachidis]|uniref:molybdopterin-dependent oxidoreductase n=1 Tax=Bradyrhizobium arachidis TaxID=858423 RepID=UPI0021611652|nr:molybdopterin-dependent oxidoreductase [Bradyrhizobium arachidis]UVO30152.1 molybdopterin-dependent oxidoreductase [Bradyrhizobium arachidis]